MNHFSARNKTIASAVSGLMIVLLLASCGQPQTGADAGTAAAAGNTAAAAEETPSAAYSAENENADHAENGEGEAARPSDAPAAEPAGEEQELSASGPASMTPEERMAIAGEYIDQPVSALIERIGEPDDRDYAKSCFGDGEDGNLYYDGFIVFTYRENGEETVRDVDVE